MTIAVKWLSNYSWFKIKTKDKVIYINPGYAGHFNTHGIAISEFEEKGDLILNISNPFP